MIGLKETTKWDEDYTVPNHTYILNEKGELEAYIIAGTNEYRTFKEVTINNGGPF